MKKYVPYIVIGGGALLVLAMKAAKSGKGNNPSGSPGTGSGSNSGSGASLTTTQKVDAFIQGYGKYAYDLQARTRFPGILALAQAAWETGWGKSIPGNNMFGIKAGSSWKGATVNAHTFEYTPAGVQYNITSNFRAYSKVADSWNDYYNLMTTSRYKHVLNYVNDPKKMIELIKAAGYATGPEYASKVTSVMRLLVSRLKVLYPSVQWPTI